MRRSDPGGRGERHSPQGGRGTARSAHHYTGPRARASTLQASHHTALLAKGRGYSGPGPFMAYTGILRPYRGIPWRAVPHRPPAGESGRGSALYAPVPGRAPPRRACIGSKDGRRTGMGIPMAPGRIAPLWAFYDHIRASWHHGSRTGTGSGRGVGADRQGGRVPRPLDRLRAFNHCAPCIWMGSKP